MDKKKPAHNRGPRYEAYHNGDIHYNGKPCKTCGTTLKFTINWSCVLCNKKMTRERSPAVFKKWAQSELGRKSIATFRTTDTYKRNQNKWKRESGKGAYYEAKRRKLIVDQVKELSYNELNRIEELYCECAKKRKETGNMYEVDHIVPIWKGGKHHPDNLQILTYEDHRKKCSIEMKEFNEQQ